MKKLITVEAKSMLDIKGKELLYILIGDEGGEKVIINVGQKTYDSVKERLDRTARPATEGPTIDPNQTKLQFEKPVNKPNEKPVAN